MFAIIRTGGKQYRVAENDRITVERLSDAPGSAVALQDVLMIGGDATTPVIDADDLAKASVAAEIIEHRQGDKVIVFKKQRRKNHRRFRGHRQLLTILRIGQISASGEAAPVKKETASASPTPAPAEEPPVATETVSVDDTPAVDTESKE